MRFHIRADKSAGGDPDAELRYKFFTATGSRERIREILKDRNATLSILKEYIEKQIEKQAEK